MFNQARRTWREFSNGQPGYRFQRQYRRRQETTNGLFDPKNLLYLAGGVAIIVLGVLLAPIPGPGGIIGFVGLIAPHIARLLFGGSHARLIPASALLGALLLLLADNLARTVAAPLELPVGIVTALLGAPFFLYLLKTRGQAA